MISGSEQSGFFIFLLTAKKTKSRIHTAILLLSVVLCAVFALYVGVNLEMLRVRAWSSTDLDIVIGLMIIIAGLYATWLGYGAFIPLLIIACVVYPFFGKYLPQPFTTTAYSLRRTIASLSTSLKSGLYDGTLTISANYVFLFSVFGGILSATGVQKFFYEFGKLTVGRFRSGTAQIACINTMLVGMVVGSSVANVSITGPICIEGMRKAGYNGVEATAIVTAIITSYIAPRRFWPTLRQLIQGFADGAVSGVQVGCVCATIGMMVQTFNASGIGIKLTSGIQNWSGGILLIALLIIYGASIVAGMVGVTVAAYFTAAAFAVPALVEMGVPYAVAHLFIVYPASFATITPPVALASLVASRIANTKYGITAIESCNEALCVGRRQAVPG